MSSFAHKTLINARQRQAHRTVYRQIHRFLCASVYKRKIAKGTTDPRVEFIFNQSYFKQDKVNYAVSEREDRVTGAMTLTRKAGCNGMYWAATVLC